MGCSGMNEDNGKYPKYRVHLLGLAHTVTSKEYASCAYTQKVLKMGQMLMRRGHTVFHYGAEGSDLPCTEHITCVTKAEQEWCYEGYDWKNSQFKYAPDDKCWQTFNKRAIEEIKKRKQPKDILLMSMGNANKPVLAGSEFEKDGVAVEMGIGYTGVFHRFRIYESYFWQAYIWGMVYPSASAADSKNYEFVIPNYFDPDDFEFSAKKEDYFLYLGRLIPRKGIQVAAEAVDRIGGKLIIAGQGDFNVIKPLLGKHIKCCEYVGFADIQKRSDLMKKAKAIFVPTLYIEPFGGVNVEAQFCGTPAITSDAGGFIETVKHGVTGYRCRTLDDFIWAALNVHRIDPKTCRDIAVANYSLNKIVLMYEEVFFKLSDLFGPGWYTLHPEREQLDWLVKV